MKIMSEIQIGAKLAPRTSDERKSTESIGGRRHQFNLSAIGHERVFGISCVFIFSLRYLFVVRFGATDVSIRASARTGRAAPRLTEIVGTRRQALGTGRQRRKQSFVLCFRALLNNGYTLTRTRRRSSGLALNVSAACE